MLGPERERDRGGVERERGVMIQYLRGGENRGEGENGRLLSGGKKILLLLLLLLLLSLLLLLFL